MTDKDIGDARLAVQSAVVKAIMKGTDDQVKAEPLGNGELMVRATHRVTFRGTVAYVNSEEDAELVSAAFKSLVMALAIRFSQKLVGDGGGDD